VSRIEPDSLRRSLSRFSTGVAVVTSCDERGPFGFTVQSLVSLSLDPPLVGLSVGVSSRSWPRLKASGVLAVNVLGQAQVGISELFASKSEDKFDSVDFESAPLTGCPWLTGCLSYLEGRIDHLHEVGDHVLVVVAVESVVVPTRCDKPLIRFASRYAGLRAGEIR
jgi:flavin reductase (DIM6/NTAB) family NADH-FMN oxidoreductase RutF